MGNVSCELVNARHLVVIYGIDKALILIENREKRRKHGGVS